MLWIIMLDISECLLVHTSLVYFYKHFASLRWIWYSCSTWRLLHLTKDNIH